MSTKLENIQNVEQIIVGRSVILKELKQIKEEINNTSDKKQIKHLEQLLSKTEKMILNDAEKLLNDKIEVIDKINKIEDMKERVYLQEKYLNCKQNKEIAVVLGCSIRSLYYIQQKALEHYLEIENK